jgi:hypothetical protein
MIKKKKNETVSVTHRSRNWDKPRRRCQIPSQTPALVSAFGIFKFSGKKKNKKIKNKNKHLY